MISILYVEDDELMRFSTQKYLQYRGFAVETVSSGTEALITLAKSRYDAVLSDYNMPGMNGIDLLKAVRRLYPGMPFILFTGKGAEDVAIEAFECGADYYIQKGGMIDLLFTDLIFKLTRAIEYRKAEKVLELSRLTLDNSGDAILWIDDTGSFFYANDAATDFFGYSKEELCTMKLSDINPLIQPGTWDQFWNEMNRVNYQSKELFLVHKSGVSTPREVTINLMMHKGRQFLCLFARDITERIRTEQQLNQYTRSLEQSNEQLKELSNELQRQSQELDIRVKERTAEVQHLLQKRTELIARIGHDLKTPLTSILALLAYIRKKEQDQEVRQYIEIIMEDAVRMKHLIASTLDLLYYESGHHVNTNTCSRLPPAVTKAVECEHYLIEQKGLRVTSSIPEGITISMPYAQLEAICSNLVSNAVKYSPPGGAITITADREENGTTLIVADTGIGLGPDEIHRVFEEFYKADPSRHDGESHGLGLSIIKRIVESYNGTITVASEGKDKGTMFTVFFAHP